MHMDTLLFIRALVPCRYLTNGSWQQVLAFKMMFRESGIRLHYSYLQKEGRVSGSVTVPRDTGVQKIVAKVCFDIWILSAADVSIKDLGFAFSRPFGVLKQLLQASGRSVNYIHVCFAVRSYYFHPGVFPLTVKERVQTCVSGSAVAFWHLLLLFLVCCRSQELRQEGPRFTPLCAQVYCQVGHLLSGIPVGLGLVWVGWLVVFLGNSLLQGGLQAGFKVTALISPVLRDSVIPLLLYSSEQFSPVLE